MKIDTSDPRILLENGFCELARHVQDILENHKVYPAEITLPIIEGINKNLQLTLKMSWSPKVLSVDIEDSDSEGEV